jgi:hypothetical protein
MHRILLMGTALFAAGAVSLSAQQPATPAATAAAQAAVQPRTVVILPGTKESAFSTIQGNALTSANGQLAGAIVRLRDARLGRIVDTQVTDRYGFFAFRRVDPGSYVVELMGNDHRVVAASEMITVNAGDAVSAVVRLPTEVQTLAAMLGHDAQRAAIVSAAAAAAGVLARTVATTPSSGGLVDISPR